MKKCILTRIQDNGTYTKGSLRLPSGVILACLERPWKNNERGVSCIPTGTYHIKMTMSNRFKKKLYLVQDVPNRDGIRIHAANWAHQLEGCIALGISHGIDMILQSQIAMNKFHAEMGGEDGILEVIDATT